MKTINIAGEFTRFPSGRFRRNGSTSGEEFREEFLEPLLRKNENISVELDGTIGYGSSFLEEAFGGLVRSLRMSSNDLKSKLELKSSDPTLIEEIFSYIEDAGKKLK